MSQYSWREVVAHDQGVAGAALTNTVTATSLLPAGALWTMPGNLLKVGTKLHITAAGQISNVVTAAPTFAFDVRLGSVSAFTMTAQCSTTAHTSLPWKLQVLLTCRAIGATTTANFFGVGEIMGQAFNLTAAADAGTGHPGILLPTTTPAAGTGFDSTASNQIDLRGTWSAANASNSIQVLHYMLELLN